MNLPFFIARKYFLSGKKKNFINLISIISMLVVAVGTASLIISLSVFNGLEGLLRSMYGNFDPDLIVHPANGKSFALDSMMEKKIEKIAGVKAISHTIEDNALVRYKESQRVVRMKGVSRAFEKNSGMANAIVAGELSLVKDTIGYAVIGRGIQYDLSINLNNEFYALQIYYPREIGPSVVNPEKVYKVLTINPVGIFAIEKYYDDNFIFVPIEFARELLSYNDRVSYFEVYLDEDQEKNAIKEQVQLSIGDDYNVILGEELHSDLYRVLKIEKLFVFLVLAAIIGIASINIFFVLTMLVIEKKKDISVLFAQGASQKLVLSIFLYEGGLIALSGTLAGLSIGITLSVIQQKYGIVGMGMHAAIMNSYPVKIELLDVLSTITAIIIITVLASIQPAIKASKTFSTHTLQ